MDARLARRAALMDAIDGEFSDEPLSGDEEDGYFAGQAAEAAEDEPYSDEPLSDDDEEEEAASSDASDATSDEEDDEDVAARAKRIVAAQSMAALAAADAPLGERVASSSRAEAAKRIALRRARKAERAARRKAVEEAAAAKEAAQRASKKKGKGKVRREKAAPVEVSSKRRHRRQQRGLLRSSKPKARDPRFDPLCGDYDDRRWRSMYGFVAERKEQELQSLRTSLRKAKDDDLTGIQSELTRRQQELVAYERSGEMARVKSEWRKKERQAVKAGKRPFHLKKREVRNLELEARYEKLKKAGRLDSYLAKRRKRNASKSHAARPWKRHRRDDGE
eukprot:PLAT4299.1.p1 GENE.PLAT4299.1~~PLAT4299.1.p1  ORF type:complete len:335 (-),score=138.63 PLAT4299.1:41-1045(-)